MIDEEYCKTISCSGDNNGSGQCDWCQIKCLELEVSKLRVELEKCNKANTILVGSEYHDSPSRVICELQSLVRSFQESMGKAIGSEKRMRKYLEEETASRKGAKCREQGTEKIYICSNCLYRQVYISSKLFIEIFCLGCKGYRNFTANLPEEGL